MFALFALFFLLLAAGWLTIDNAIQSHSKGLLQMALRLLNGLVFLGIMLVFLVVVMLLFSGLTHPWAITF